MRSAVRGGRRGALGIVEAAFGAGEQRGGAGMRGEGLRGGRAAEFVGEEQRALLRPVAQQRIELHRHGQLGQRRARALLGRLDHDRAGAFGIELVGDAAPGQHRPDRPHAEFGRLLEHEVKAVLLEQRRAQPEVGNLLARAEEAFDIKRNFALAGLDHACRPFAGEVVAQHHGVALVHAHDLAEIVRGRPFKHHSPTFAEPLGNEQPRRAARGPGGCGGHYRVKPETRGSQA